MTFHQLYDVGFMVGLLDVWYPRALTQIDRDPDSPTYGSCDRHFWMYRLHDFDSGVLQQTSLTLAALSGLAEAGAFSGCRYLKAEHAPFWRELALAINRRTAGLLRRRGMLDEYYPAERSYPGTVFAAYAALKSALMLEQTDVIASAGMQSAARALSLRGPSPAANQDAAAAAFLLLYAATHGDRTCAEAATRMLGGERAAGHFREYGGADIGYGSVTLAYLASMRADGTRDTADLLRALGAFLAAFVTPGGRFGGEFASRSTTYVLPFGFLETAYLDPLMAARFGALDLRAAFEKLDDRYLMHYCMPSLAMAALRLLLRGVPAVDPSPADDVWTDEFFPNDAIWVLRRGRTAVHLGLNKGGAFQVEVDGGTYIDCGYRIRLGGQTYSTCVLDEKPQYTVSRDGSVVEWRIRAAFWRYGTLTASSTKTVILRLLQFLGTRFNAYFKSVLIKKARRLEGVELERVVCVDLANNTARVSDVVRGAPEVATVRPAPAASPRLVPSAKFYQDGEEAAFLRHRDESGTVTAERTFHIGGARLTRESTPK